jgi:hypothetical protein
MTVTLTIETDANPGLTLTGRRAGRRQRLLIDMHSWLWSRRADRQLHRAEEPATTACECVLGFRERA